MHDYELRRPCCSKNSGKADFVFVWRLPQIALFSQILEQCAWCGTLMLEHEKGRTGNDV